MASVIQPQFGDVFGAPYYERIAWYLFEGFLNDTLPDYVYGELALATEDLIAPMREYANTPLAHSHVTKVIEANQPDRAILAIRLATAYGDDDDLYKQLRARFLSISIPIHDRWLAEQKRYIATTIPYFRKYADDADVKQEMLSYFEATRRDQVETTLRYFGGIDAWPGKFEKALSDNSRRPKHWVYIWCFKAICQEGLFGVEAKHRLKEAIRHYADDLRPTLSTFEDSVIQSAISV